ncbi:MAG: adenosine deaminase, partial [Bifidobacteriaceae bacterium]|nr:adenosine deaminase [Bifidobacteriaceae bacterium]
ARRAGLASVPHGGELLGADHAGVVFRELNPDRIGHGVRATEDPAVLDQITGAGVAFELCPWSNVALGVYPDASAVPLRQIVAAGGRVALGADDPLIFGARLVDQYRLAREAHGFTDSELAELARASVQASRATTASKRKLLSGIDRWLAPPPPGL